MKSHAHVNSRIDFLPKASPGEQVELCSLERLSDDALMGIARKRTDAFDALVRRHQQKVYRICVKFLGNTTDAKDVAQNSFVELYRYLDQYQQRGRFISFLGRIVLN